MTNITHDPKNIANNYFSKKNCFFATSFAGFFVLLYLKSKTSNVKKIAQPSTTDKPDVATIKKPPIEKQDSLDSVNSSVDIVENNLGNKQNEDEKPESKTQSSMKPENVPLEKQDTTTRENLPTEILVKDNIVPQKIEKNDLGTGNSSDTKKTENDAIIAQLVSNEWINNFHREGIDSDNNQEEFLGNYYFQHDNDIYEDNFRIAINDSLQEQLPKKNISSIGNWLNATDFIACVLTPQDITSSDTKEPEKYQEDYYNPEHLYNSQRLKTFACNLSYILKKPAITNKLPNNPLCEVIELNILKSCPHNSQTKCLKGLFKQFLNNVIQQYNPQVITIAIKPDLDDLIKNNIKIAWEEQNNSINDTVKYEYTANNNCRVSFYESLLKPQQKSQNPLN
ncbi:hypothetical protein EKK58_03400 [Candidatus Dependentiae bacterium]|nr:MAG: hypothetical protein EKK58_03400 [Candidatus Dependentiae bacterium]